MIQARKATVNDARNIAFLGKQTFTETFGDLFDDKEVLHNYLKQTFSQEKIHQSLEKENNVFWIATVDQQPVGYAKLKLHSKSDFVDSDAICQLQKIYVLQEFLSQRIGLQLQSALLEEAENRNFEHIWLSVLHTNTRAIRFYKKTGFGIKGKHDFQIGPNVFHFVVMAKAL